MTLAETLQKGRAQKKIPLRVLSEKTGLSIVSLCHYENGNVIPNINNLYLISKVLDLDYDELFELQKREKKANARPRKERI